VLLYHGITRETFFNLSYKEFFRLFKEKSREGMNPEDLPPFLERSLLDVSKTRGDFED